MPKFKRVKKKSIENNETKETTASMPKDEKGSATKHQREMQKDMKHETQKDKKDKEVADGTSFSFKPTMKGKKTDEDTKILLRDVKVLKQSFKKLQERVEKLENEIHRCSTPTKDPSTMSQNKHNDDDIVRQDEHSELPDFTSELSDFEGTQHEHDESYRSSFRDDFWDDQREQYKSRRGRQKMEHYQASHYSLGGMESTYRNFRVNSPQNVPPLDLEPMRQPLCLNPLTSSPMWSETPFGLLKDSEYLETVKRESSSVGNFAARLNCKVFTVEERMLSNVSGSQGKQKLDPQKILAIKNATFATYPTDMKNKPAVWKGCVKAIDEINRRLHRK